MPQATVPHRKVTDLARWGRIRLLATDVDGILTDGGIIVTSNGDEAKQFSVLDGYGLARLREAGVLLAWISGRHSTATTRRGEELRIPIVHQGVKDKAVVLRQVMAELGVARDEVCYCGDDINDLDALALAGIPCTVPNALPSVFPAAQHITDRPGGRGAVRELCDWILEGRAQVTSPA